MGIQALQLQLFSFSSLDELEPRRVELLSSTVEGGCSTEEKGKTAKQNEEAEERRNTVIEHRSSPSSHTARRCCIPRSPLSAVATSNNTKDMENNQNTRHAVAPSTQSVRAKSDPTWDHCQSGVDEKDGKKFIKCSYCAKSFKGGGIHRMKQHLAGEKGEVISCPEVPFDVRYRLREHLNQVSGSRKRGNSHIQEEQQNAREDNVRQHQGNAPTQPLPTQAPTQPLPTQASMHPPPSGSGSGSGSGAGSISSFFAPRTTPGAQPSIRMGFAGKDAIHRADMAVARFF
ncbi:hypothetical protein RIF29_18652 [Crotalaria pallida]|uniref:BED-type domain-containing protein n=1 Tax=Crotalaria pallida TaxID=3830 RepID=A0AAN9F6B2_CROPI